MVLDVQWILKDFVAIGIFKNYLESENLLYTPYIPKSVKKSKCNIFFFPISKTKGTVIDGDIDIPRFTVLLFVPCFVTLDTISGITDIYS